MTKSPTREVVAKKAHTTPRKTRHKAAAEKASTTSRGKAPKAIDQVDKHPKVAAEFSRRSSPPAMSAHSTAISQFGATQVQVSMRALAAKSAPHQIEDFHAEVPASLRELVERNVAQTRSLYQSSANAFQEVFESWESSLDAAGPVALNRKVIDIAARNISTGFDLVTRLLACKNLAEALEVQTDYWRRQSGELRMQVEEVRVLLEKVTSTALEPIKAQVTRDIEESIRRIRSAQP
jgi:hypothetical protein